MTEKTLEQKAREVAQEFVNVDDDFPRIYYFVKLEGLRPGEQVVVTVRREHRSYNVPVYPLAEALA